MEKDRSNKNIKKFITRGSLLLGVAAILILALIFYFLTPRGVQFKLNARKLPDGDRKIALRAVDQVNLDNVLYQGELQADINHGLLTSEITAPKQLNGKSYIAEICIATEGANVADCFQELENQTQPEPAKLLYSCPYFVENYKTSRSANILNRNIVELDDRLLCGSGQGNLEGEFKPLSRINVSKSLDSDSDSKSSGLSFNNQYINTTGNKLRQTSIDQLIDRITNSDKFKKEVVIYRPESTDFTDSDNQQLVLSGDTLSLTNGGSVNLSSYGKKYQSGDGLLLSQTNIFSINSPTCTTNQKLLWTGTNFTCEADIDTDTDTNTTYSAGDGLALNGTTFSLDQQGAINGQVLMWSNTDNKWIPQTPATFTDTDDQTLSYNPTTHQLTIADGNTITFPLASSTTDGLLSSTDWNTFNGKENVLTFTDGLTRTGNTVQLMSCTADQILQRNTAGNAWICVDQVVDTDTTYTAGAGITITGPTNTISSTLGTDIDSSEIVDGTIQTIDLATIPGLTGGTYNNVTVNDKGQVVAATNINYLTTEQDGIIGNEVSDVIANSGLMMTGSGTAADPYKVGLINTCNDGQLLKYTTATGWACATDIDTDTDDQTLTYNPTSNQLTIADGNTVDLSNLNNSGTDDQTISLNGNTLAIEDGNSVDLAKYLDNTDTQDLGLNTTAGTGNTVNNYEITLVDGGSVTVQDTDTKYTAGNGVNLNTSNVFAINAPTCTASQKLTWNGTDFLCTADIDTNTDTQDLSITATPGTGGTVNTYTISLVDGGSVNFVDTDTTIADDQTLSYNTATGQLTIDGGNTVIIPLDQDTQDLSITNTAGTGNVVNDYTISLVDGGSVVFQDTDTKYTAGGGLSLNGSEFSIDSPICTDLQMLYWNGTSFVCEKRSHDPVIMPVDLDLSVTDVGAGDNSQANMHNRNYIAVAPDGQGFIHLDFKMKSDTGNNWNNPIGSFDPNWVISKLSEIQTHEEGYVFAGYQQGVVHGGKQLIAGHRYVVNIPVFVNLP